jgi:hypothetical protein
LISQQRLQATNPKVHRRSILSTRKLFDYSLSLTRTRRTPFEAVAAYKIVKSVKEAVGLLPMCSHGVKLVEYSVAREVAHNNALVLREEHSGQPQHHRYHRHQRFTPLETAGSSSTAQVEISTPRVFPSTVQGGLGYSQRSVESTFNDFMRRQEYHKNDHKTFTALQEIRKKSVEAEAEAERLRGQVYRLSVRRFSVGALLKKVGVLALQSFTLPLLPVIVAMKVLHAVSEAARAALKDPKRSERA